MVAFIRVTFKLLLMFFFFFKYIFPPFLFVSVARSQVNFITRSLTDFGCGAWHEPIVCQRSNTSEGVCAIKRQHSRWTTNDSWKVAVASLLWSAIGILILPHASFWVVCAACYNEPEALHVTPNKVLWQKHNEPYPILIQISFLSLSSSPWVCACACLCARECVCVLPSARATQPCILYLMCYSHYRSFLSMRAEVRVSMLLLLVTGSAQGCLVWRIPAAVCRHKDARKSVCLDWNGPSTVTVKLC